MPKLTERQKVKKLLGIPFADLLHDATIDDMIAAVSEEVEEITRRKFSKAERTEYYVSYEQTSTEPDPQPLLVDAWPIDLNEPLTITWSLRGTHDENATEIESGCQTIEDEKGMIWVTCSDSGSIPYAENGFKIIYTGGYEVSVEPDVHTSDPTDDFGVTEVPASLKAIVAQKVAADFKEFAFATPFSDEQRKTLKAWTKKDLI